MHRPRTNCFFCGNLFDAQADIFSSLLEKKLLTSMIEARRLQLADHADCAFLLRG